MNTQKKIILAFALTISLVTLAGTSQPQIFAEETDEKQYTYGNDVSVHTVFDFYQGTEESDGFQVFNQISGFDNSRDVTFKLEGIVDYGNEILYEEVTNTHGKYGVSSQTGLFDADVYLINGGEPLRHFEYTKCKVSDYKVTTLFDKEEGWNTSKGFVLIDEFTFLCMGYQIHNPQYELMKVAEYLIDIETTVDQAE